MNTYNYQTHSRTILGDLHTPVSTYLKSPRRLSPKCTHGKLRLSRQ